MSTQEVVHRQSLLSGFFAQRAMVASHVLTKKGARQSCKQVQSRTDPQSLQVAQQHPLRPISKMEPGEEAHSIGEEHQLPWNRPQADGRRLLEKPTLKPDDRQRVRRDGIVDIECPSMRA
jgi:hypothetical protein